MYRGCEGCAYAEICAGLLLALKETLAVNEMLRDLCPGCKSSAREFWGVCGKAGGALEQDPRNCDECGFSPCCLGQRYYGNKPCPGEMAVRKLVYLRTLVDMGRLGRENDGA